MKHTAGPWLEEYHQPGNDVQHGLGGYSIQTRGEGIAYNVSRKANAHLIAAAPDLLEAAEQMIEWLEDSNLVAVPGEGSVYSVVKDLRAAIAKAKGESGQ